MPLRIRTHITYPKVAKPTPVVEAPKPRPKHIPRAPYGTWDDNKDAILKAIWGRAKLSQVMAAVGMSQGAVYRRVKTLGLALIP